MSAANAKRNKEACFNQNVVLSDRCVVSLKRVEEIKSWNLMPTNFFITVDAFFESNECRGKPRLHLHFRYTVTMGFPQATQLSKFLPPDRLGLLIKISREFVAFCIDQRNKDCYLRIKHKKFMSDKEEKSISFKVSSIYHTLL